MQKSFYLVILLGLSIYWLAAYRPAPPATPTAEAVRKTYLEGLNTYKQNIRSFNAELARPGSGPQQWQIKFRALRQSYKRIEFLVAYLDEESARDYLNGPPLPWVNRVIAEVEVVQPMGMQITEEHLYAEDVLPLKPEIQRLATELEKNFESIRKTQLRFPITDRQILEAVRAGIFRVTSLGLVGFDTPGSGESLLESAISLETMSNTVGLYFPYLDKKYASLADSIEKNFEQAIYKLRKSKDFESFDRLNLIRDHLEPLYGQILRLHLALGIETVYQVTTLSQALNYMSPNMFSEDVLNDHYYAGIGALQEKPEAIELGRLLFFDPVLSENNERACASCHRADKAFTDGLPKSEALNHQGNVGRNAPTLINSVFADRYFHDLRSDRLENQAEHVVFNPKEFNTTYFKILEKLDASDEYRRRFKEAFGKPINVQDISRALAAYVRSLKTFNSPVDRYLRGEKVALKPEVQLGFNLFMGKALCGTCHFAPTYTGLVPPTFTENESEVIGVPLDPKAAKLAIDPDYGRYDNGRPRDRAPHLMYSFKTSTVRNADLTGPYMHNGVYRTLDEVVDFYNRGGGAGMGIDLPHQTLPFDHLSLSADEQSALVSFMQALTDTSGTSTIPRQLPVFERKPELNKRTIGGVY